MEDLHTVRNDRLQNRNAGSQRRKNCGDEEQHTDHRARRAHRVKHLRQRHKHQARAYAHAVRAGEHEYRRNDHHACKQRHAGVEKLDLRNGFVEVNLRLHIRAVGDHNAHRNAQREEQLAHCIEQNLQKALHGQPLKVRGDVVEEAL